MTSITTLTLAVALVWLAAACQHNDTDVATAGLIDDGRVIAETQCAACHAVGKAGASPRSDAPPLRVISRQYQFPVLEEELIEGVKLGHEDMPRFQIAPRGVDALVAYMRHIQIADREAPAPH